MKKKKGTEKKKKEKRKIILNLKRKGSKDQKGLDIFFISSLIYKINILYKLNKKN